MQMEPQKTFCKMYLKRNRCKSNILLHSYLLHNLGSQLFLNDLRQQHQAH